MPTMINSSPAVGGTRWGREAARTRPAMIPVKQLTPSVVVELLRRQPLSPAKVGFAWRTAAGPALGRAATAALREDGTILIRTTTAAWAREVERSRALLLVRMREMLGPEVARRLVVRTA